MVDCNTNCTGHLAVAGDIVRLPGSDIIHVLWTQMAMGYVIDHYGTPAYRHGVHEAQRVPWLIKCQMAADTLVCRLHRVSLRSAWKLNVVWVVPYM